MSQKAQKKQKYNQENIPNEVRQSVAENKKASRRRQGNDYVFKRYKLEENQILSLQTNKINGNDYVKFQENQNNINEQQFVNTDQIFLPDIINFEEGEEINQDQQVKPQEEQINENSQVYQEERIKDQQHEEISKQQNIFIPSYCQSIINDGEVNSEQVENDVYTNVDCEKSNVGLKKSLKDAISNKSIEGIKEIQNFRKKIKDPNIYLQQHLKEEKEQFQRQKKSPNLELFIASDVQIEQQVQGLKIQTDPDSDNVTIEITNKQKFVSSPLPPGIILKCKIRRSSSLYNLINPQFDLYLANGLKHVLSAKKYSLSKTQVFKFSLKIGEYDGKGYLGSLMANVVHSQYLLAVEKPGKSQKNKQEMIIFAAIMYEKMDKKKPQRPFKVVLPSTLKNVTVLLKNYSKVENLKFFIDQFENIMQNLQMKSPPPSEKNFILVDQNDSEYQYLKLQKQSDNTFQLLIQHPLSPLQAMAIAMTRFEAQLK